MDMDTSKIMLQPSEWIIMEKLWEVHPMTLMQLYHELKIEPGWSKSTVTTLLGRMVDKGILYYEDGGKAKQYYPKVNRDDAAITETESLLERVYKGSVSMMMSTLIRNNNLSETDLEELYQILGEALENDDFKRKKDKQDCTNFSNHIIGGMYRLYFWRTGERRCSGNRFFSICSENRK